MRKIEADIFKCLVYLELLSIRENEISEVESGSFKDLLNLKDLRMSQNKLTRIDANVFDGLVKLEYLHLDHNQIASIDLNAFCGLSRIKILNLADNKVNLQTDQLKCFENPIAVIIDHREDVSFFNKQALLDLTNEYRGQLEQHFQNEKYLVNYSIFLKQFSMKTGKFSYFL